MSNMKLIVSDLKDEDQPPCEGCWYQNWYQNRGVDGCPMDENQDHICFNADVEAGFVKGWGTIGPGQKAHIWVKEGGNE